MRTKNAARITPAESAHLHFVTVALCTACHSGKLGVHGDGTMLRLRYGTADLRAVIRAINETQRRVAALEDA